MAKSNDVQPNPEQDPNLEHLADELKSIYQQEIPLRPDFKSELGSKLAADARVKSGKSSPSPKHQGQHFLESFKSFFRFPWPKWAYAGASLVVVVGLVGSVYGWSKLSQKQITSPAAVAVTHKTVVYADTELTLAKLLDSELGVLPKGSFAISSKESLNRVAFVAALKVEPAIAGDFTWSDDSKKVTFVPKTTLATGTTYHITVASTALNDKGEPLASPAEWSIQTIPTFAITSTTPADQGEGVDRTSSIEVQFNYRNVALADFQKNFSIDPSTPGKFEQHDSAFVFLSDQPLAAEKLYTVTVKKELINQDGYQLTADKVFQFRTTRQGTAQFAAEPWLDFDLRTGAIVSWTSGHTENFVGASSSNMTDADVVKFELYPVDQKTLLASRQYQYDRMFDSILPDLGSQKPTVSWQAKISELRVQGDNYSTKDFNLNIGLPNLTAGYYLVKATNDKLVSPRFIYIVVQPQQISQQVDNNHKQVVWVVDFSTGQTVPNQAVDFYTLRNQVKVIGTEFTDGNGLVVTDKYQDADAIVSKNGLLILNSGMYYTGYAGPTTPIQNYKAVMATDRPIYRQGDTVKFKAIIRMDNDGSFSPPPKGSVVLVSLGGNRSVQGSESVQTKLVLDNTNGSIAGEIKIPETTSSGDISLTLFLQNNATSDYIDSYSFPVDQYRKPDYEISVSADKQEVLSGDTVTATIKANYFFGQPVSNKQVKYTVYRTSTSEPLPGVTKTTPDQNYWYGGDQVEQKTVTLDTQGTAVVKIKSDIAGKLTSQQYSLVVEYTDESEITTSAGVGWMVHQGDFAAFAFSAKAAVRVSDKTAVTVDLYGAMSRNKWQQAVPLSMTLTRSWTDVKISEQTVYNPATKKQDVKQTRTYNRQSEAAGNLQAVTDAKGQAVFQVSLSKPGSYTLDIVGQDQAGRAINTSLVIMVSDGTAASWWQIANQQFSLSSDHESYKVGDKATLSLLTDKTSTMALAILHKNNILDYQLIKLDGGQADWTYTISEQLRPNGTVAVIIPGQDGTFMGSSQSIVVNNDDKKLLPALNFTDKTYLPGDQVNLQLMVNGADGKLVANEATVYLVDKSALALNPSALQDWQTQLYAPRNYDLHTHNSQDDLYGTGGGGAEGGGGCFPAGTTVQTPSGPAAIETIRAGDSVWSYDLATSKVVPNTVTQLLVHSEYTQDPLLELGLSDGTTLDITANHRVYDPKIGDFKVIGDFAIGDKLLNGSDNNLVTIVSKKELGGGQTVYNLALQKTPHTYLVGSGIVVHNDKNGESSVRKDFRDSALFDAQVQNNGNTQIQAKLPDNLTTWVAIAQVFGPNNSVGQTTRELVVTKKLILRPSLPGFLVTGDKLGITTMVNNYTGNKQTVSVDLTGSGFDVVGSGSQKITVNNGDTQTVIFNVQSKVPGQMTVHLKAQTADAKAVDEIEQKLPVMDNTIATHQQSFAALGKDQTLTIGHPGEVNPKDSLAVTVYPSILSLGNRLYSYVEGQDVQNVPAISAKLINDLLVYQLAPSWLDKAQMTNTINNEINFIRNNRTNKGWGYSTYDSVDILTTMQAMQALGMAKNMQWAGIDADMVSAGLATLNDYLNAANVSMDDKAFILYVEALFDQGNLVKTQQLADHVTELLPPSQAFLSLALTRLHDSTRAYQIMSNLLATAKQESGMSYFQGTAKSFQRTLSAQFQTGIVLFAATELKLPQADLVKMAQWIMISRNSSAWKNLYDADAMLTGLVSYASELEKNSANFTYEVFLNDQSIGKGKVENGQLSGDSPAIIVPNTGLQKGDNTLRVQSSLDGFTLYVATDNQIWNATPPASSRITLDRIYSTNGNASTMFNLGDTITVEYHVNAAALQGSSLLNYTNLALREYFPAGIEFGGEVYCQYDEQDKCLNLWPDQKAQFINYSSWLSMAKLAQVKTGKVTYKASFRGTFNALPTSLTTALNDAYAYTSPTTITIK